jgi:hypothetical protein
MDIQGPKRRTRRSLVSANTSDNENPKSGISRTGATAIVTTSRTSMSSVSTINDSGSNSGYSTPGTSAVATPATIPRRDDTSRYDIDLIWF